MCIVIDIQTLVQILVQFEITGAFFSGEKSEMQKFSAIVNICKHIFFHSIEFLKNIFFF